MPTHRESPVKRVNPSGKVVWKARYTDQDGRRRSAGTFKLKSDAQKAIDKAYDTRSEPLTVAAYLKVWTARYPRAQRTNVTNEGRVRQVLAARLEGRALAAWPLRDLRRRHALELVDHMLRVQGRASTGAQNILRSLSAMTEDAITDECCEVNPFKGVRVRASDVRAVKPSRKPRVLSFEEMHAFAAAASTCRRVDRRDEIVPRRGSSRCCALGRLRAQDRRVVRTPPRRSGRGAAARVGQCVGGSDPGVVGDKEPRQGRARPDRVSGAVAFDAPEDRHAVAVRDAERARLAGQQLLPRRLAPDADRVWNRLHSA